GKWYLNRQYDGYLQFKTQSGWPWYESYTHTNVITAKKDGQKNVLYDSATWKETFTEHENDATMYRFQGEFHIDKNEAQNYAYTIKTVADDKKIYINDDIFVFVYPQTVDLTEENYMQYLAFWT